jgi:polar amino acid transport system substrate-binding protein
MKSLILSTAVVALTAGAAFADGHGTTIRMGTEGAYEPYNFINDNGEVDGFEIELGNELCARAELTCEWVTNDWDSIIPNLVSGNYDTIMAGMSITAERDEVIDFSQDYYPPTASASPLRTAAMVSSGVANSTRVAPDAAMNDAWMVLACAAITPFS